MNIFYLDKDPKLAAKYHCDRHVVKMIVESAQILSTVHHEFHGKTYNKIKEYIYKPLPFNNPCVKWCKEIIGNYNWLALLGLYLCNEYTKRYNKIHKTESLINLLIRHSPNISEGEITIFKTLVPFELRIYDKINEKEIINPVESYRNLYINDKFGKINIKYNYSETPEWLKMGIAKRALNLPKDSSLRKDIEAFLSGKSREIKCIFTVKKGNTIETKDGFIGKIIKYPSNNNITIIDKDNQIKIITKEKILKICETTSTTQF